MHRLVGDEVRDARLMSNPPYSKHRKNRRPSLSQSRIRSTFVRRSFTSTWTVCTMVRQSRRSSRTSSPVSSSVDSIHNSPEIRLGIPAFVLTWSLDHGPLLDQRDASSSSLLGHIKRDQGGPRTRDRRGGQDRSTRPVILVCPGRQYHRRPLGQMVKGQSPDRSIHRDMMLMTGHSSRVTR